MARKVTVLMTDDLSTDETPADETVEFALDGQRYEIDLTTANATAMREALSRWVGAARRASGKQASSSHTTGRRSSAGRGSVDRERTAAIRRWAEDAGLMPEGRKGRIPAAIVEQWENRGKGEQTAMPAPASKGTASRAELNAETAKPATPERPKQEQGNTSAPKKAAAPKKETEKEKVTA